MPAIVRRIAPILPARDGSLNARRGFVDSPGCRSAVVRLRSAVCMLGRFPALAGADLDIDAGEIVLVSGANGAGKTTLLRLCARVCCRCAPGTAEVLGVDLGARPPSGAARARPRRPRDVLLRRSHRGRERSVRGPRRRAFGRRRRRRAGARRAAAARRPDARPAVARAAPARLARERARARAAAAAARRAARRARRARSRRSSTTSCARRAPTAAARCCSRRTSSISRASSRRARCDSSPGQRACARPRDGGARA